MRTPFTPSSSPEQNPPAKMLEFQQNYSRYLRAPAEHPLPQGVPERRSKVYEELLFNNICGFIDRCFPVARKMLGAVDWRKLSRDFYRDWQCHTPYFSRIPYEFVQFVAQLHNQPAWQRAWQPPWFAELVDYEWRELEVDLHSAEVPRVHLAPGEDQPLQINPTLQNLQYLWPVHRISPEFIPEQEQATFLLVYRSFDHRAQFMEINAVTSLLLQLLQNGPQLPQTLLDNLAKNLPQIPRNTLMEFGGPLLNQLLMQNVLLIG
jgi:hypothetical protein